MSKTDNRQASISYSYDAFNRITAKSYTVPSSVAATPNVAYCYGASCPGVGNPSYAIGRLTSVDNGNSKTLYTNFDALGRVLSHSQITAGSTYSFSYTYNLAGDLLTETYPSQRTVTTTYDGADRPLTLAGTLNNTTTSYVTQAAYSPSGQLSNLSRGNGVGLTLSQDNRLRPNCTTESNASNVAIWSGCASWNPNSTLSSTQFNHAGPSYSQPLTFTQTYSYDPLNRLTSATDKTGSSTGTQNYARTFNYDALGNMWVASASGINPQGNTPTAGLYTNNQLTGGTYDAAGNQTIVNGNTITYDVENRQTSAVGTGVNETYVYDADGKRVEKAGYNGSPATVFVYDASGQLAAEYSTTPNNSSSTWYLTLDYLGTPRMVTDQSGAIIARHDYLPFGEEISANQAGRGAEWGPGSDSINQKFTAKERDAESGLDYFGARYYGSALGRFTSPDPEGVSASSTDPQTWNAYSYIRNSPLSATDPTGEAWVVCEPDGSNCVTVHNDSDFDDFTQQTGSYVKAGTFYDSDGNAIGTASWYDSRAENAYAFANWGIGVLASNYLYGAAEGLLRVGAEAFAFWRAGRAVTTGVAVASQAGRRIGSMKIIRTIAKGESISDLVEEAKVIAYNENVEVAVVKLASGERALVTGGEQGINLGEDGVTRIYGHSHPVWRGPTGPSSLDFQALDRLGQRSSYIYEGGQLYKFGAK